MCMLCAKEGIFSEHWREAHDGRPLARQRAKAKTLKHQIASAEALNEQLAAQGGSPAVSPQTIEDWREQMREIAKVL